VGRGAGQGWCGVRADRELSREKTVATMRWPCWQERQVDEQRGAGLVGTLAVAAAGLAPSTRDHTVLAPAKYIQM